MKRFGLENLMRLLNIKLRSLGCKLSLADRVKVLRAFCRGGADSSQLVGAVFGNHSLGELNHGFH